MSQKFRDGLFVFAIIALCVTSILSTYEGFRDGADRETPATCEARLEALAAPAPVEATGAAVALAATPAPAEDAPAALPVATEAAPAVDPATGRTSGVTATAPGQ